jgi:hypothetical protein
VGLRPLAYWDFGFESSRGHGCLSVVSVVCCQVEVSATDRSLVQRSPTKCGVSECDREALIMRRAWPTRGSCAMENKTFCGLCDELITRPEESYCVCVCVWSRNLNNDRKRKNIVIEIVSWSFHDGGFQLNFSVYRRGWIFQMHRPFRDRLGPHCQVSDRTRQPGCLDYKNYLHHSVNSSVNSGRNKLQVMLCKYHFAFMFRINISLTNIHIYMCVCVCVCVCVCLDTLFGVPVSS